MVQGFSFPQEPYKLHDEKPKTPKSPQIRQSASEKLQILQQEIDRLKAQEAQLRDLMRQVSEQGARAMHRANGSASHPPLGQNFEELAAECEMVHNTYKFAQSLQELMGVLKLLEKQIRQVERCEEAGDLEGFRNAVHEAVTSHNTAAAQCDTIGQLETTDLPDLLLQQSISMHKRASHDMARLLECLKRMLRRELGRIHWPPPLSSGGSSPNGGYEAAHAWQGFAAADTTTLQNIIHMLSALTSFQRSVQQSSFEEALKPDAKEDPPELWGVAALTDPIIRRMHQHFAQNPQFNAINHPEWIFHVAIKMTKQLSGETNALQSFLSIHQLERMYHLPFEFARCIRSGVQKILKDHHLPSMHSEGKSLLWLNFAEKALDFEKQMAPLMGLEAQAKGPLARYSWRSSSCFSTICSNKDWRQSWWQAEREDAWGDVEAVLKGPHAWTPTHQVRGLPLADDSDDDATESGSKEAYQAESWPPLLADTLLESLVKLSKKTGLLPDSMVRKFSEATVQPMLREVAKTMAGELRRLKEFDSELTPEGLSTIGGILCGAHYLETVLPAPDGDLMVFEAGDVDDADSPPSIVMAESDAFAKLRLRGTLQAARSIANAFKRECAAYIHPKNHSNFSRRTFPETRPEYPSGLLQKPAQMLQYHLELLSKVVDSEIFREACKCVPQVLNRLLYNTLIMETHFSIQGGWQLEMDVKFISSVFGVYHPRPESLFRDCLDAAKILSIDVETANEAARCVGRDNTHVPEPLQSYNIRLKVDQIVFVLTQRM